MSCASPPGIQLEEPLLVGEMEHVDDQAVGLGEGEAAQDVHAERRQHAGDVREQERLVRGEDGQLPGRVAPLEPGLERVAAEAARQPDVPVDRVAREQLQVAPRQPLEERLDLLRREVGRARPSMSSAMRRLVRGR